MGPLRCELPTVRGGLTPLRTVETQRARSGPGQPIHRLYSALGRRYRSRRNRRLALRLDVEHLRVLDIGGVPEYWADAKIAPSMLSILNIDLPRVSHVSIHSQRLVGDACRLPVRDSGFDLAFSNSCIEHVGDWTRQQSFAAEARRVAQALWIQTPAKGCPIEPHYLGIAVHWLPKRIQRRIIRRFTAWGLVVKPSQEAIDRMVEETRLLSKKEFQALFPDCVIETERIAGVIPKSYTAVRLARS